ncbi:MAG TPA: ATP-binding protein, partial [Polyangiaceae bacterium]|nr:ATP-binding protein [Polyangiaceae bacterium]
MVAPPRTLHGRDAALRALGTAVEGALAGRGQLASISGEAGVGKSALAVALARDAEAHGFEVTWGRAWEFADAPPYFPV